MARVHRGSQQPKAFIRWVGCGSPVPIDEMRIFLRFFKNDNPLAALPGLEANIDPDSLETVRDALVEVGFWALAKRAYEARPTDPNTPAVDEHAVGQKGVRAIPRPARRVFRAG